MNLSEPEIEKIRLHVGIHSGYKRIERDEDLGLIGSRRHDEPMKPLPRLTREIKKAGHVFQYLSSPLLHDLNRMNVMLNAWEEKLHPVPNKVLKELIQGMESWIMTHGGRP